MSSIRLRPETGLLFFDIRVSGTRYREQTALQDSPENRALLEKQLAVIEAEIKAGTFDYSKHFPNSRQAQRLAPAPAAKVSMVTAAAVISTPTFSEFSEVWMGEMEPMWRIATRKLHPQLVDFQSAATKGFSFSGRIS